MSNSPSTACLCQLPFRFGAVLVLSGGLACGGAGDGEPEDGELSAQASAARYEELTGFEASASSQQLGGEASRAFDRNLTTPWENTSDTPPPRAWLKVDLGPGRARALTRYDLYARTSPGFGGPKEFLKSWKLQGGDCATWRDVDTRTGQSFGEKQWRTFEFANASAHRCYRFLVLASAGGGKWVDIPEAKLYVSRAAVPDPTTPSPTTPSPTTPSPTTPSPDPLPCAGTVGLCSGGSRTGVGGGRAYYVGPNGSDGNPGTAEEPLRQLAFALRKLRGGDTLYLRGGSYDATIGDDSFSESGTAAARIYVSGYPGDTATLDAKNARSNAIALGGRQYITFRNLAVRRYARVAIQLWGSARGIAFENLHMYEIGKGGNNDYSSGFEISAVADTVVRNSRLDDIGTTFHHHGVYLANGSRGTRIYNNWITRATGGCVHAWHAKAAIDTAVYNNLLSCRTWGIVLGDGAQGVRLLHNTIYSSGRAIELFDHGEGNSDSVRDITVINNILYGSGLTIQPRVPRDTLRLEANYTGDPRFVDLAGGDLRLRPDSPAVNAGVTVDDVAMDIVGTRRPQGAAHDIGAYER